MYRISELSELTGLSKETLCYYEKEQLLEPASIDPANHYRYYDDGSYFLAVLLQKLRGFGCTNQEMKIVMKDESFRNQEELLSKKKERLLEEIAQKHQKIMEIEQFLESGQEEVNE